MEDKRGFFHATKKFLHDNIYINKVPSYGNTIFYSFGFILIALFILLGVTGTLMVFFNKPWWLTSSFGVYVRSVHMWAAEAFIMFLILHLVVTFSTSAFRNKKIVWVAGIIMLFLFTIQAELGFSIRGDFSSQWRALQGADFWNGNLLGHIINPLDYSQIFGIHTLVIPLFLVFLVIIHYGVVRARGISKPQKKGVKYKMVEANHNSLYLRASIVIAVVLVLGIFIQSPFLSPVTVKEVSMQNPSSFARTLISEYNHTSDTSTYQNTVDPYTFDTRSIYITLPYEDYLKLNGGKNMISVLEYENPPDIEKTINLADAYFANNGSINLSNSNPMVSVASALTIMGQSGLYDAEMKSSLQGGNSVYLDRILSDTGYMDEKADGLGLSLEDYGMIKDETGAGIYPPNSWWMAPFNLLDNTVLKNDPNQDADGGLIIGILVLILATFPWLPYINKVPEKLGLYKLFWREGSENKASAHK
jgi:ubiquinol-cytochrome c reductase cytochrome b subunit